MNPKYKAGLIFGIFCAITSFINAMFIVPGADPKNHIVGIIVSALVCGTLSGFMFGWFTNWYKARQAKNAE